MSRNFILTPLKFIAKIKPLQKNVVLQCSKKPQWLPYTKWLFTYPVLSKHWSKSICVFLPTSVKVDRSVMSILNDLYMYTVKLFHLKYKLHNSCKYLIIKSNCIRFNKHINFTLLLIKLIFETFCCPLCLQSIGYVYLLYMMRKY